MFLIILFFNFILKNVTSLLHPFTFYIRNILQTFFFSKVFYIQNPIYYISILYILWKIEKYYSPILNHPNYYFDKFL
jgi:hypothetical protein